MPFGPGMRRQRSVSRIGGGTRNLGIEEFRDLGIEELKDWGYELQKI